jgi:hypothetical protein
MGAGVKAKTMTSLLILTGVVSTSVVILLSGRIYQKITFYFFSLTTRYLSIEYGFLF